MTRVSTFGNYQSALLDLMAAQISQQDAQERVSTRKNATDLTGFGRGAETLTAMKGAQNRLQGFLDTGDAVAARLQAQDLALTQMVDAITGAREAIAGALAADSNTVLMLDLQGHFQSIQNGLNTRHQGGYLFAGANTNTPPVNVGSLAELAAAPDVASVFTNDQLKPASRIAEATSVETGFLADALGADVFQILRDIQAYHSGPNGPLSGKPNDTQKAFLTAQLSRLDAVRIEVTDAASRNGSLQNRIDSVTAAHVEQMNALDALVSKRTDADMARAVTDLQLSQIAVQASAQVVSQLSQVSLLNYLR